MKKIVFVVAFFLIWLFYARATYGSSNFSTDYDVTYTVNENGVTNVNLDVVLTNKTSDYYASSYNISVGYDDIENLKSSDQGDAIVPVIIKNNDETNIELNFNSRVVGIDNKLNFNLSFDTKSVAKKAGKIWEIHIPGLSNQENFQSFNVGIQTPTSFGKPSYIKPAIESLNQDSLTFTKNQLGSSGIYIGYGDFQIFEFRLTYHLKNPNLFKVKTEIALPPSTNYQEVEINEITPLPQNVVLDEDGNWLAEFELSASQKVDVVVNGKAKVSLLPRTESISKEDLELYLKEQPHWQVSNPEIKSLAQRLKTPRAIYDYVVENLTYDITRVSDRKERLGAASVLENPNSAVCLEFTDLFIALARAAGIPAREVDGFAYTENPKERPLSLVKDILHAWPQFYDFERQTWIMVDPTWGNTTKGLDYFDVLDFDHFAFVIKGKDSQYPIPAGGYKLEGQEVLKDVDVSFGDILDSKNPQFTIDWDIDETHPAGLPIRGTIVINNLGNTLLDPKIATVASNFLSPSPQQMVLDIIPPFGFSSFEINFQPASFLTRRTDTVTIAIADRINFKNIKIYPIFLHKIFFTAGGVLIAAITIIVLSIFAIKTGRLSFFGQKVTGLVRWKGKES